jgi:uncharacterized repeat protein (TIGR02543 family)
MGICGIGSEMAFRRGGWLLAAVSLFVVLCIIGLSVFGAAYVHADDSLPQADPAENVVFVNNVELKPGDSIEIKEGEAITVTLYGSRESETGTIVGETKYIPWSVSCFGGNALYYDYSDISAGTIDVHHNTENLSPSPWRTGEQTLEVKFAKMELTHSWADGRLGYYWVWAHDSNDNTIYHTTTYVVNIITEQSEEVREVDFQSNYPKKYKNVKELVIGRELGPLPVLKAKGWKFLGWYDDNEGGKKLRSTTILDEYLYTAWAQWSKTFKVKFNANSGKASKKSKLVRYNDHKPQKYGKLPTPKRSNYRFKGWYTKKSGGKRIKASSQVTTTKTKTLYAHWFGPKGSGSTITWAEYCRIKEGLFYSEVVYLIGGKGKMRYDGSLGTMYRWNASGGSYACIWFDAYEVSSKSWYG